MAAMTLVLLMVQPGQTLGLSECEGDCAVKLVNKIDEIKYNSRQEILAD